MEDNIILKLNALELGVLVGLTYDGQARMPRSLQLKMNIASTSCYLDHPTLGAQAKTDIEKFKQELDELGVDNP